MQPRKALSCSPAPTQRAPAWPQAVAFGTAFEANLQHVRGREAAIPPADAVPVHLRRLHRGIVHARLATSRAPARTTHGYVLPVSKMCHAFKLVHRLSYAANARKQEM